MNDSSAVRALLAASEPDGPQAHELCSVAFLAAAVQSFHTKRTNREALHLVFSALCGFRTWAGLAPSQLTVYELGYLDRITPLCRTPIDCDDGEPPLPSEFESKFKSATDMNAFFVVWADARQAFGLNPPAAPPPVEQPPPPAPSATEPPATAWRKGRYWSDEAKNEMRQQRADGLGDGRIAAHWGFKRQNVARLIGSQRANKAKANTPKR